MQFLDIHTHHDRRGPQLKAIQSFSLTAGMGSPAGLELDQEISVGLHPWFATLGKLETDFLQLTALAKEPRVKLIGECGLDRLKGEPLENQLIILNKQLSLASELQKPVILHCVRCFDELIALKKAMKPAIPLIIHGFNKHQELGQQLLAQGFYLSFGKAILNADSGAAALIKHTDVFFLETDDAACGIEEIYEAAANLKNCTLEELKALIFANWKKIKLI